NEKLTDINEKATERNLASFNDLKLKSTEAPEKYETLFNNVQAVRESSVHFNSYLDSLKAAMVAEIKPEERTDYEVMDKSQFLDQAFFGGGRYTAEGQK